MTTEATYAVLGPALCVAAQGAKVVMLGRELLEYDPAHLLVFAVDLPVSSQVSRASRKDPYLGFTLVLDPARVGELAARVYPRGVPKASDHRGLYVGRSNDDIVDAVTRLLDLMAQPEDADLLGPLVVDEILIRLLRTPIGHRVAQIGRTKSGLQRMADAVTWIRAHFAQPVTVEAMAASVHMGASSFHQRFKAVTTMSPLQYQKVLRLHEARRLMLFQNLDASDACRRVGYLSASQFSREYSRFFGNAPSKDITRLHEEGLGRNDGDDRNSGLLKRFPAGVGGLRGERRPLFWRHGPRPGRAALLPQLDGRFVLTVLGVPRFRDFSLAHGANGKQLATHVALDDPGRSTRVLDFLGGCFRSVLSRVKLVGEFL
jgi:AraC-like DNA-binding protein